MEDELASIATRIDDLDGQFTETSGFGAARLPSKQAAIYRGLLLDAKAIVDDALKAGNEYSTRLAMSSITVGGITQSKAEEAAETIRSAIRQIKRKAIAAPPMPPGRRPYVAFTRIAEMKAAKGKFDFKRLIELCRELNVAAAHDCHMATAMLVRAIIDHVPPVLGYNTFIEVSAHYKAGGSLKSSLQRLEKILRKIADLNLHNPIRDRESLPAHTQVDFSQDLDILLGEVVRVGSHS